MKARLVSAAWLALAQAAAGYELERPGRGRAFMKDVRRLCEVLSENHAMGKVIDQDLGLRQFPLRKFPYGIVYQVAEGTLRVHALADGRRRAGYWRKNIDGVEESTATYSIDETSQARASRLIIPMHTNNSEQA